MFRQNVRGEFVCFFENCEAHMHQNFSRHLVRHERDNDRIDPAVAQEAAEFEAKRGFRTILPPDSDANGDGNA